MYAAKFDTFLFGQFFKKNMACSNSSNQLDEKHPIKILNCHEGRKTQEIKLQVNEHEVFLQQA